MKEYIEREAFMKEILSMIEFRQKYCMDTGDYDTLALLVAHFTAADVVSRAAFDQVMWERDVAIQQLREDYGVGLGEKKNPDVVALKRGEWVKNEDNVWWEGSDSRFCSCCGQGINVECIPWFKFCPNCGADMREDVI